MLSVLSAVCYNSWRIKIIKGQLQCESKLAESEVSWPTSQVTHGRPHLRSSCNRTLAVPPGRVPVLVTEVLLLLRPPPRPPAHGTVY